jgi:hypothetical protein
VLALIFTLMAYRKINYTVPNPEPGEPPLERWRYAGSGTACNLLPLVVLVAGLATLYFLVRTLRCLNLRLVICDRGFRYSRWGRTFSCRWDEIDSVYYVSKARQSALAPERHFCEINKTDGASLTLPALLPHLEEICATIREEANHILRPRALAALRRGEAVAFGDKVLLAADGLTSFQTHLAWEEISDVSRTNGHLIVSHRDPAQSGVALYLGGVANADTLSDLLEKRSEIAPSLPRGRTQASRPGSGTSRSTARGGYVCPRCGGLAERGARGNAGGAGGLAGALLALAVGSFWCQTCGAIPRHEFPAPIRRRMLLHSVFLIAGAVLCLAVGVVLVVALRRK